MKYRLCPQADIPNNSSRGFTLPAPNTFANGSVFAVRKQGRLHVYENRCPHIGIELEWQPHQFLDIDHALIQCATHGALFVIEDGLCVTGPCQGERLRAIPFDVDAEGYVVIELAAPAVGR